MSPHLKHLPSSLHLRNSAYGHCLIPQLEDAVELLAADGLVSKERPELGPPPSRFILVGAIDWALLGPVVYCLPPDPYSALTQPIPAPPNGPTILLPLTDVGMGVDYNSELLVHPELLCLYQSPTTSPYSNPLGHEFELAV